MLNSGIRRRFGSRTAVPSLKRSKDHSRRDTSRARLTTPSRTKAIGALLVALSFGYSEQAFSQSVSLSDARLEFGEVGSGVPLCQALLETARQRVAQSLNQCTAPVPSNDARFGQVKWQILQPADHMELLQQIFVWSIVHGNWIPNSQSISRDLQKGPPLNDALIQDIWNKYKRNYPDLVNSGKIHLERTSVDLAPGASMITVYRTNLISAPNQSGESDWKVEQCSEVVGQAPLPEWRIFFERRAGRWDEFINLNSWVYGRTDLIVWADRAYQIDLRNPAGFVIPRHNSRAGSVFAGRDLCVANPVWD